MGVDPAQDLPEGRFGLDQQGAHALERPAAGRHLRVADRVGDRDPDRGVTEVGEEPGGAALLLGRGLDAEPAHDRLDLGLNERVGGVDPIEHIEADRGAGRVEGDDAVAEALGERP